MKTVPFLMCLLVAASASAQDSWQSRATGPVVQGYNGGGAVDGKLVTFGGFDFLFGDAITSTWQYDPTTDAWTERAPFPAAIYSMASGVLNGRLYSFGGGDIYTGEVVGTVLVYDPDANAWTELGTPLSSVRLGMACAAVGDAILVIGGEDSFTGPVSIVEEFTPSTGAWRARASMPGPRSQPFAGTVSGKVYVAGGVSGVSALRSTIEYDPAQNTWSSRADMPDGVQNGVFAGSGAVIGTRLICVGGSRVTYDTRATFEYRPTTDRWYTRARMPYGIAYGIAGVIDGKVYAIGDGLNGSYGAELQEYTPIVVGTAPEAAIEPAQKVGEKLIPDGAWMGGDRITFEATIDDADFPADKVSLDVEVRKLTENFTNTPNATGAFVVHNRPSATFVGLSAGDYKWQVRGVDQSDNAGPWTPGLEFRCDQVSPTVPSILTPADGGDAHVTNGGGGEVTFQWTAATDNGVLTGYEIQIIRDGVVLQGAAAFGTEVTLSLAVSRFSYQVRVRSVDHVGNTSVWSAPHTFRVTFDDGRSSAAGDADKACGFGAPGSPATLALALLVGALFLRRR